MKRAQHPSTPRHAVCACLVLLCAVHAGGVQAWSLDITSGARRLFLHVGDGALSGQAGTLNGNGGTDGIVNTVAVALEVDELLSRTPMVMRSDSNQSSSLFGNGNITCPQPSTQVMIGAGYRRNGNNPGSAVLTVFSPPSLTNLLTGDTIPITEIGWTVSAANSSNPGVIPGGNFSAGTQTLTSLEANKYIETCHTFVYANNALRAEGTYTGRVTYTLSSP